MMTPLRLNAAGLATIGFAGLLAACTTLTVEPKEEPPEPVAAPAPPPPLVINETAMLPLLGYFHLLQRMSAGELTRERQTLNALPTSPAVQVRLAMLLGMPRTTTDLPRALALLEAVQRSHDPEAASLHPLARLLAAQYQERGKLEAQSDRLGQQLKESQRRRDELQEKIEALTNIERSIPVRPNTARPAP